MKINKLSRHKPRMLDFISAKIGVRKLKIACIVVFFILASYFSLPVSSVNAQTNVFKVVVVPPKQNLELAKGETQKVSLKFYNDSDAPISGNIKVVDFVVLDNKGTPELLENIQMKQMKRYSAAQWVTLPYERMTISAKDRVELFLTITAPGNALPGGHYFAIIFEAAPGVSGETPVNGAKPVIAPRLVGLINVTVPGKYSVSAIISELLANKFLEFGPIEITGKVKNTGGIHLRPKTYVQLTNLFGQPIDTQINKDVNIFPGVEREYTSKVGSQLMFGRYKAKFNLSYGNGQLENSLVYIWVIPWRVIAVIILALVILYILVKRLISASQKQTSELEQELKKDEDEIEKLKKILKKRKD